MKAVVLYRYGGPEELKYEEAAAPRCGQDEVLVRVRATSVNPIDFKLRSGAARSHFPIEFPAILGRDLAGEVVEWGSAVKGLSAGMRVMALTNRTYAESVAVKAEVLAAIPDELTFEQAGALPLVTLTGAQLIERAVKPQAGQTVLVTGALGGVGRTAVHVARKHGARVLAGVRAKELSQAEELNADEVVAIDDEAAIARLHGLDAIADTVGGKVIQRLFGALREGGVIGSVLGRPEGADRHNLRVEAMMAQPDAARLRELADDVARKEFSIPTARVMRLDEAAEAQRIAERGGVGGKIVLLP